MAALLQQALEAATSDEVDKTFSIRETLAEATKLESIENPVNEPFKTYYEARKILLEKRKFLENEIEKRKQASSNSTRSARCAFPG